VVHNYFAVSRRSGIAIEGVRTRADEKRRGCLALAHGSGSQTSVRPRNATGDLRKTWVAAPQAVTLLEAEGQPGRDTPVG